MAEIKPFLCVRPTEEKAAQVAALPYDVYSREEAAEQVKGAPLSFLNIDRPETQFSADQNPYAKEVYEKAAELIQQFKQEGIFIQEEEPCFYLYELTRNKVSQTGIVVCASVEDYEKGVIKKHENTRVDKEKDRICHVDICSTQTGPIFLACKEDQELVRKILEWKQEKAIYDFVAEDGIRHRVFRLAQVDRILFLQEHFKKKEALYIADGHHRAASAVKVSQMRKKAYPKSDGTEEFNYFLSVIFPADELHILDYNRAVQDLNGLSEDEFLQRVGEIFEVENRGKEAVHPDGKGVFGMYLDKQWYKLIYPQEKISEDEVERLDVSILQNQLLCPILGIEDPKTDERIQFIGGIRGLGELEYLVDGGMKVAFSMYPTSMEELFAVADADRLMPPKSTWFEPKLRSGLFLHEIER